MTSVDELARRIRRLERQIEAMATPQLGNSTIEDGSLVALDDNGQPVLAMGQQPDGSYQVAGLNGGSVVADTARDGAITETAIADDSISTPKLQANSITAEKLEAVLALVSRIVAGDPAAARVELNGSGLYAYDLAGNQTVAIDGATGSATWAGDVEIRGTDSQKTTATLTVDDTYGIARLFFDTLAAKQYVPAQIYYDPNQSVLYLTSPQASTTDKRHSFVFLKQDGVRIGRADERNGAGGGEMVADSTGTQITDGKFTSGGIFYYVTNVYAKNGTAAIEASDPNGNLAAYFRAYAGGVVRVLGNLEWDNGDGSAAETVWSKGGATVLTPTMSGVISSDFRLKKIAPGVVAVSGYLDVDDANLTRRDTGMRIPGGWEPAGQVILSSPSVGQGSSYRYFFNTNGVIEFEQDKANVGPYEGISGLWFTR